jgi:ubiquinone/menaquinone biosynthesis C-methylase UbiE
MTLAFSTNHLINPYNNLPVRYSFEDERLIDKEGNEVPVIKGIPNFLSLETIEGLTKKYISYYDRLSRVNDASEAFYKLFVDLDKLRGEWLSGIEVKRGYKVLDTSVGSGGNFKVLPQVAEFYGIDSSAGMLKQCQRNSDSWNIPMHLFQGNAEYLPFKNDNFDSVFNVGGINSFNNPQRAINEMVRVARPGAKIVLINEMGKSTKRPFLKIPFIGKFYISRDEDNMSLNSLTEMVPAGMADVEIKMLDKDNLYQLSFRKPQEL